MRAVWTSGASVFGRPNREYHEEGLAPFFAGSADGKLRAATSTKRDLVNAFLLHFKNCRPIAVGHVFTVMLVYRKSDGRAQQDILELQGG